MSKNTKTTIKILKMSKKGKTILSLIFINILIFNFVFISSSSAFDIVDYKFENIVEYDFNQRDYDWYIDQGSTGKYSKDNCVPSVLTMAIKYLNQDSNISPQLIREDYHSEGGLFYLRDIMELLNREKVDYRILKSQSKEDIKRYIRQEKNMIAILDTTKIEIRDDDAKIGVVRGYSSGHSVLIKGYIETEDEFYIQIYDPDSFSIMYEDQDVLKGEDRLLVWDDFNRASKAKIDSIIVIDGRD